MNYQNKAFKVSSRLVKRISILTSASILIVGGFFVPSIALATAPPVAVLGVTQISAVSTFAQAGGDFAGGWKWIFNVTVPDNEPVFTLRLADWTNASNGTIPVGTNVRFYSAQSSNANTEAHAITLTGSGVYSDVMNLNQNVDLDATAPGRQIQVIVEARIPAESAGGSYSTSYGINSAVDTTAPVITLIGNASPSVPVGTSYHDEGATALDNIDGDITSHIITINPVNTSTLGAQVITYNVADVAGNHATEVTRTVTVTASDISALITAKTTAASLITANAPELGVPGQHVVGSLTTLIAAQSAANATEASAQSMVDGQVTTLNTAITAYNEAIVPLSNLTAYNTALSAVIETDYTSESWSTYQTVVLANVRTAQDAQSAVDASTGFIISAQGNLVTKLAAAKVTAHEAITSARLLYTDANYTSANLVTLNSFKSDGDSAIDNATDLDGVALALSNATTGMAGVVTDLLDAKTTAHNTLATTLNGYNIVDYSLANWTTLTGFKSAGDTAINTAITITAVTLAQTTATTGMAGVATIAQTLAVYKITKLEALATALGTYIVGDYVSTNWDTLNAFSVTGIASITSATDLAGVDTAFSTATTGMAGVETIAQTLAIAKVTAHGDLTTARALYLDANYSLSNLVILNGFKSDGDVAIEAATDLGGVNSALLVATEGMAGVITLAITNALQVAKDAEALLISSDYVDYSAVTLALALPEATTADILAKTTALTSAMSGLITVVEINNLQNAKDNMPPVTSSTDYTLVTWTALADAFNLPETTNAEIVAKTLAINSAVDALVNIVDLSNAINGVVKAENSHLQNDVNDAVTLVSRLPSGGVDYKDLWSRLLVVQNAIDTALKLATSNVVAYETASTTTSGEVAIAEGLKAPADQAVVALYDPADQAAFQVRIDNRAAVIEVTAQALAESAVDAYEVSLITTLDEIKNTEGLGREAVTTVDLVLTPTTKSAFTDRITARTSIVAATKAVLIAETSRILIDSEFALSLVNALPDGQIKIDLLTKIRNIGLLTF